jgi:aspartate kinase
MAANGYHGETQYRRTPTAITAKEAITVLNVRSNGRTKPHAFLGEISERIGRHNLTIDLISSSQQMVSLAVSGGTSITSIDEVVNELDEVGVVTAERHMSIVSVVGHKMRNIVGVAGEVFGALARARVNVHLISQGASEINISFVVRAQDVLLAMDVVHTNVMRIPVQSEQENIFIKGELISYFFPWDVP